MTVDCKLKFDDHITTKVNKANSILGIIRRSDKYLDKDTFLHLYKALVRPHLEYANAAWSPKTQKQINLLEGVQRRATKLLPKVNDMEYIDRLKCL